MASHHVQEGGKTAGVRAPAGHPELGALGNCLPRALSLVDSGTFCLLALRTVKMPPIVQVRVAQKAQPRLLSCKCGQWPRGFTHPILRAKIFPCVLESLWPSLPSCPAVYTSSREVASCLGWACAGGQRGGRRQVGDPCSRNAPPARTLGEERGSPLPGSSLCGQPSWSPPDSSRHSRVHGIRRVFTRERQAQAPPGHPVRPPALPRWGRGLFSRDDQEAALRLQGSAPRTPAPWG